VPFFQSERPSLTCSGGGKSSESLKVRYSHVCPQNLPQEVLHFLAERIDTVPHLEALLIIWGSDREWGARELSARIYLGESSVQELLQDLLHAGLLTTDDSRTFKFEAAAHVKELMPEIAETYRRNISHVATLIHNKASPSVREFARAFDFKKDR
jgi:hypothetical protein